MQNKKELRRLYSEKRALISSKMQKDKSITERILADERIANSDTVLLYASFGSEISTVSLIKQLLANGKRIALPRCESSGIMTFHIIDSPECLSEGKYGIYEPSGSLESPAITKNTSAVVPGLAFTEKGFRLGYGGGYYDRFLSKFPFVYTVGVVYEELIAESLPSLPHDITVNAIATEERMVLCCAEK